MSTYSRLKNLVRNELPARNLEWQAASTTVTKNVPSFEPEHMQRVTKFDFETGDRCNQWVEDTLRFILDRKRFERSDPNKEVLYLFRMLSILYRLESPTTATKFEIKPQVLIALESKICTSLLSLFDKSSSPLLTKGKKSRSTSKQPAK